VGGDGPKLVYRDGHSVRFVEEGPDEHGPRLVIEHVWTRPALMAGPHWHPALTEAFTVREGQMSFRVDGVQRTLGPGESLTITPRQVHEFRNVGDRLVAVHEVRPPGQHRAMFELWHRLDREGRTVGPGIPRNPLWLGVLWERQDGYIAGPPPAVQRLIFGGLARLARTVGYRD
jgi:mannose-6-phosphate isomerase-like protein (cupin superfamily)